MSTPVGRLPPSLQGRQQSRSQLVILSSSRAIGTPRLRLALKHLRQVRRPQRMGRKRSTASTEHRVSLPCHTFHLRRCTAAGVAGAIPHR